MALFFIYRVNGGKVITASVEDHSAGLPSQFAQIQDPSTPDGINLGVSKIKDGSSIRNATAGEIANFATAEAADNATLKHEQDSALFDLNNLNGVALKALAQVVIDELNVVRQWTRDFKTEVAAASNLADLKTRVATLSTLADRTAAQARTAVKNAINSGDND